ncbi:MAG TPA: AIR synthase [Firmicutes bacterium]|nr:AIR synthase [Candidatus Fermentithermobacillaceae bacterium]
MNNTLNTGKIPPRLLQELVFTRQGAHRKEVVVKPAIGEDAAVVDVGSEMLVVSTDPITGAAERAGWLAVKVAVNDIGACGAEPVCILVTLLLPEGFTDTDLSCLMEDIHKACAEENVAVAGGHSEVTPGLSKPIISVTAIGKTRNGRVLSASGARPGDDIVVTKWAGMEGTAILAKDFREVLSRHLSPETLDSASQLMDKVSVTLDGQIALANGATGCHDATEGGVLGAIYEICEASGTGAVVETDRIPILESTRAIASLTKIDPLRLVSSGCLIVTTPRGAELCQAYREHGINAEVVGKITLGERQILESGRTHELRAPEADELWRARRFLEELSAKS